MEVDINVRDWGNVGCEFLKLSALMEVVRIAGLGCW